MLARDVCSLVHQVVSPSRPHTHTQKHLSQKMMRARVLAQGFTIAVLMAGKDMQKQGEGRHEWKRPPAAFDEGWFHEIARRL